MHKLISTVLGIGYSPIAPGTAGALFAVFIFWFAPELPDFMFIILIVALFFIGVLSATSTEGELIKHLGIEKGHDPHIVVIDEFTGMLIALFAVPKQFQPVFISFLLFRFFDIVKPFPINISQKIPKGWGIMIDDVIAGIYANLLIRFYLLIT